MNIVVQNIQHNQSTRTYIVGMWTGYKRIVFIKQSAMLYTACPSGREI